MAKDYRLAAYIVRSRGVKGEVEVYPVDARELRIRPGARLMVVPPSLQGIRETSIVSARGTDKAPWLFLAGVDDRTTASLLKGRYLLVATEDWLEDAPTGSGHSAQAPGADGPQNPTQPATSDQPEIPPQALGMDVHDLEFGYLGVVSEQSHATPQVLWTVTGPFGDVLIPAVSAFIRRWNDTAIYVSIPRGLLELNK